MSVTTTTSYTIACDRCDRMTATPGSNALPTGWRVMHLVAHRRDGAPEECGAMDLCPDCVEDVKAPRR